jgi:hypothetical protein
MEPIPRFIEEHSLTAAEYLADGVYVAHEGWQLWLLTERDGVVHNIALEPTAIVALLDYAQRVGLLKRKEE